MINFVTVLHRSSSVHHRSLIFNRLVFYFEALNSFYAPLGVHPCSARLHLQSSIIGDLFFLFCCVFISFFGLLIWAFVECVCFCMQLNSVQFRREVWSGEIREDNTESRALCSSPHWTLCLCRMEFRVTFSFSNMPMQLRS